MSKGPIKYSDFYDDDVQQGLQQLRQLFNEIKGAATAMRTAMVAEGVRAAKQVVTLRDELEKMQKRLRDTDVSAEGAGKSIAGMAGHVDGLTKKHREAKEALAALDAMVDTHTLGMKECRDIIRALEKEYSELSADTAENRQRQQELIEKIAQVSRQFNRLNGDLRTAKRAMDTINGTYARLSKETNDLRRTLQNMPDAFDKTTGAINKNNKEAVELQKNIQRNTDLLKAMDAQMGMHFRNVGNYSSALKRMGGGLLAFSGQLLGISSAGEAIRKIVGLNLEVADSLSDVRRTAELAALESYGLVDALKSIPSRTGLNDLLQIATIGGQLGIAKDELAGFVQALDFLSVSLKNEIPGGAEAVAEALGKINGVFRVAQTEGLTAGEAMQKTGSAILALGQAGLATGSFLVDFTQRVGGAASVTGIALPTMLAYGATLEEAGVSAEVAGTAVSKLIGQLAARREDFHAIARIADANITLQEFTNLINTDADAALRKFFAGLKAGGSTTTQFYDVLSRASINTERYRNAVLLLANDQEKLTNLTKLATEEYETGAKAAEQFALRNMNLPGVLSQVGRKIGEAFINPQAQDQLAKLIARVTGLVSSGDLLVANLADARKAFKDQSNEIDSLIPRYVELQRQVLANGGDQRELWEVVRQIADIMPEAVTAWDQYGNALDINVAKVRDMNDAHRQLIKDMNASTIAELNREFDKAQKKADEWRQRLDNANIAFAGAIEQARKLGVESPIDMIREQLAKSNAEAVRLAQNLQAIGAVLTPEQTNLLAAFGLDEGGAAMREYDRLRREGLIDAAGRPIKTPDGKKPQQEIEILSKKALQEAKRRRDEMLKLVAEQEQLELLLLQTSFNKKEILEEEFERRRLEIRKKALDNRNKILSASNDPEDVAAVKRNNAQKQAYDVEYANWKTAFEEKQLQKRHDIEIANLDRIYAEGQIKEAEYQQRRTELLATELERRAQMEADAAKKAQLLAQAAQVRREGSQRYGQTMVRAGETRFGRMHDIDQALLDQREVSGEDVRAERLRLEGEMLAKMKALYEQYGHDVSEIDHEIALLAIESDTLAAEKRVEHIERIKTVMLDSADVIRRYLGDGWGDLFATLTDQLAEFAKRGKIEFEELGEAIAFYGAMAKSVGQMVFDSARADSQRRIEMLEEEKARIIEIETKGIEDKEQAEAAKKRIEDEYNARIRAEKLKMARAEREHALFNIAINTAMAVTMALAQLGPIAGLIMAAVVGAMGITQAALVMSKPLPQYWTGTSHSREGFAELAERGPEILEKNGKRRLVEKRSVMWLEEGTKVYTASQTAMLLESERLQQQMNVNSALADDMPRWKQRYDIETAAAAFAANRIDERRIGDAVGMHIRDLPVSNWSVDERGFTRRIRRGNTTTSYLNKRFSL